MIQKLMQDKDGYIRIPAPDPETERVLDRQFKRTGPLEWKNEWRGLGDMIKAAADRLGIPQCGGCAKRQELFNKLVPFGSDLQKPEA